MQHSSSGSDRPCCRNSRQRLEGRATWWLWWLLPLTGSLSLIWFLVRVIPKPSRAAYPCQRAAFPMASGFVVWLCGLIGSTVAYRRARRLFGRSRYTLAAVCLTIAFAAVWMSVDAISQSPADAAFTPSDTANSPIGVAQGLHPGRVVWVHEADATSWDGASGNWWDEGNTDQYLASSMMSTAVRNLTGESDDTVAWGALFRHFNRAHGQGNVGYRQGERVTIKINMNQDSGGSWQFDDGMPSPQMLYSLLEQLIDVVGVPGSAITIYDASRYIGNPLYNKVRANPDADFQNIRFVVRADLARNGRVAAVYDTTHPVHFAQPPGRRAYLPRCVTEAKYLINMALLRAHSLFGVTLCAKNHFGSTYFTGDGWTPSPLHNYGNRDRPMGSYNCLVDLIGHAQTGGKTLLYLIDALYAARNQSASVIKFTSFGGAWCSSLFVSQDPLAIDSVALDFIRNEPQATDCRGQGVDNYMHEAALADRPASGTFYDPEADGVRMQSLGVHEHWNNPIDKQYSRNLGTGDGIELIIPTGVDEDGPVQNVTTGVRYETIRHAVNQANTGDEIVVGPGRYRESIGFNGKDLRIRSTDPNDPEVVAATILDGGNRAVSFAGGEGPDCILAGLAITGAVNGVYCDAAEPTILNCRIVGNAGGAIKLWNRSHPTIIGCLIAGNAGAGIEMWALRQGRDIPFNYADVIGCTIVGNAGQGLYGGRPTVRNSIVCENGSAGVLAQIVCDAATVTYCNVQGGFEGEGNFDVEPRFARPGRWVLANEPAAVVEPGTAEAVWVDGDYHLRRDSECIDAGDPTYVASAGACDIDGEPRVLGSCVDVGCDEVGPVAADLTRDGAVDARDAEAMLQLWLCVEDDAEYNVFCDLVEDGCVNWNDWAELSWDWGWSANWGY